MGKAEEKPKEQRITKPEMTGKQESAAIVRQRTITIFGKSPKLL
jgi:hypothetical protein